MKRPLGTIGKDKFKDVLKGKNAFVPKKVVDALKSANMSRLLYKDPTRQEALKAIRTLQEEGVIPKLKRPDELYGSADKAQKEADEAERLAKLHENVRITIQQEIEQESDALLAGRDPLGYDRRSVLGRSSVYEELNQEQAAKDDKTDQKKGATDGKNNAKPTPIKLAEPPDMEIG